MQSPIKNLLLDRDGTLIQDCGYLADPSQVRLLPGVILALQQMQTAGIHFYQLSNQSGLGRGFFSFRAYQAVQSELRRKLAAAKIFFQAELFCPHSPDLGCSCRKPGTGLWDTLRVKFGLQATQCAMVGDKPSDLEFGINAGLRLNILLHNQNQTQGHFAKSKKNPGPQKTLSATCAVAQDLPAACAIILQAKP